MVNGRRSIEYTISSPCVPDGSDELIKYTFYMGYWVIDS